MRAKRKQSNIFHKHDHYYYHYCKKRFERNLSQSNIFFPLSVKVLHPHVFNESKQRWQQFLLLFILCRVFTSLITGCDRTLAQRYITLHSIPAVPNNAVIWVLPTTSPMPKSSSDLMSRFGTVPRSSTTTGLYMMDSLYLTC